MMLAAYSGVRRRSAWQAFFLAVVLMALAASGHAQTRVDAPVTASAPSLGLPDFTGIVADAESAVVNIRTTEAVRVRNSGGGAFGPGGDPYDLFRWFFGPDFAPPGMPSPRRGTPAPEPEERTVPRGVGSGFLISDDGYILTNHHVIAQANGIFVTLTSGKEYQAKLIGSDQRTDVALIKIDAGEKLKPLPIGDSNTLKKGQWVLAIGSPFGLDSTVTAGIVSAINRDTGDYLPFIQTDVAVNPGNSGGPLIDLAGRVVGVNSQIVSRSGGFMGISLAIPIDEAMRIVDQLKSDGKVTRGRIGVQIGPVSDEVAKAIGLEKSRGAMVSNVEKDGPADKAGVRSGDVILKFDGREINQVSDLPRQVGSTKPGTQSSLEVWRRGKPLTLKVKVDAMPAAEGETPAASNTPQADKADVLGLRVGEVSQDQRKRQNLQGGVQVLAVEGPAVAAGIQQGDIVLVVNDQDISSPAQYAKAVGSLDKSRAAALLVQRGDQSHWVAITPRK